MYVMSHDEARRRACEAVRQAPDGYVVRISPPKRSLEQNALMWVYLDAFSSQLKWPVNGAMATLTPEEWKDILTAAYSRESMRVASGLDGGVVMLGLRTSAMNRRTFAEFMEFIEATAAMRGVNLHET